eukprot:14480639-Alexandrium_andersonii.AAC.1
MHGNGSFQVVDTGPFLRDRQPHVLVQVYPEGDFVPVSSPEAGVGGRLASATWSSPDGPALHT